MLWYGFAIPTAFINSVANGNPSIAPMFYFGYLVMLSILVRPAARLGF